ncbi:hypothetical protein [Bdellovibrio sp. HCB209]|uniref:hypothetical protein n=1 Tax=Bdellovibrio sp. HCB209 TaxID=3394354 RepID=UPI0039B65B37
MSRSHDVIVSSIVFSFFVGLVCIAELSNRKTTHNETVPVVAEESSKGGFSLAQVLIEQEVEKLSKRKVASVSDETQVRAQVARLSKSDVKLLKGKARNATNSWEVRYASAYLLKISGERIDLPKKPVTMVAKAAPPQTSKKVALKVVRSEKKSVAGKSKVQTSKKVAAHKSHKRLPAQVASR